MTQDKQHFLNEMGQRIGDWDKRIEEIRAKEQSASGDEKTALNEHLTVLKDKREKLLEKYNEIKEASGESWDDIRKGLEHAAKDFQDALTRAFS